MNSGSIKCGQVFTLSTGTETDFWIGLAFTTVKSLWVTLTSGAKSTSSGLSTFFAGALTSAAGASSLTSAGGASCFTWSAGASSISCAAGILVGISLNEKEKYLNFGLSLLKKIINSSFDNQYFVYEYL